MTAYLQRLLERAAPAAAAPRPALASGSPVVAFDQRLGDPGLADDYALTGAPPPEPAVPEEGPWAPLMPAAKGEPGMAPVEPSRRTVEPRPGPTAVPSRPARREEGTAPDSPPGPPLETRPGAAETPAIATAHPADSAPMPSQTVPRPRAASANPIPPEPVPSAVPDRVETRVERAREPTILELVTKPEPEARSRAEPASLVVESAPIPVRTASDPVPAEPAPPPPAEVARPAPPEAVAAGAPPLAEPVIAEPPPLAAPAASIDMSAIERLVADAVRAERAREKAASSRLPGPPAARSEIVAEPPAPPRPATAAEASVIGKLQSSAFRPMLFGVRRR